MNEWARRRNWSFAAGCRSKPPYGAVGHEADQRAGLAALPFDLVPDFVPVAGQLDDAIMVAAVRLVLRAAGPGLVREHWPGPPLPLDVVLRLAYGPAQA
jgi:hypothetical protein